MATQMHAVQVYLGRDSHALKIEIDSFAAIAGRN